MNSMCLSTFAKTASPLLLSSSSSSSLLFSPLFSLLRGSSVNNLSSWKRITNNINRTLLLSSSARSKNNNIRPRNNNYNSPLSTRFNNKTNPLIRINNNNSYNSYNNYNKNNRYFHTTRPQYAMHGTFRLAHFVAPIVLRQVRYWIGTPSTNKDFYRRLLIVIGLLIGLPTLYVYTHLEATPYTERVRFVALTSEDEAELSEIAFDVLLEEHEADFIPSHHHYVTKVVEVANRIIQATDRPDIKWEVRIVDSPITNAFAIPGGKIFVFSGILDVTKNDDGLACILGHEVAHVLARHGAEQMAVGGMMMGFSVLLSAIFGDNIGSLGVSWVIRVLTELKYSRNMEREADYIGLLLMHKAKYDINEAPKVWERMVEKTGAGEDIPFLSTHPSHGERIKDITKWVEEIKVEHKLLAA